MFGGGCFSCAGCACDEYDVFHECILGVWISYWLRMWLGLLELVVWCFVVGGADV